MISISLHSFALIYSYKLFYSCWFMLTVNAILLSARENGTNQSIARGSLFTVYTFTQKCVLVHFIFVSVILSTIAFRLHPHSLRRPAVKTPPRFSLPGSFLFHIQLNPRSDICWPWYIDKRIPTLLGSRWRRDSKFRLEEKLPKHFCCLWLRLEVLVATSFQTFVHAWGLLGLALSVFFQREIPAHQGRPEQGFASHSCNA